MGPPIVHQAVPDWTDGDMRTLAQFLAGQTGKTLIARWRGVEFHNYTTACADPMHTVHSAARARGFTDGRNYLESLSRTACVTADTAEQNPAPGSEQANADNDTQHPEQGEEQLRERYSP